MKYVSTRGTAPVLEFGDVLLEGLATDGGLYLPESWPPLPDLAADADYVTIAVEVMWPFVEGSISRDEFAAMVADAYGTFHPPAGSTPDVVPVVDLRDNLWLAEIFWGPTLAFKDIALQLVGRLFDHELERRHDRVTIVGATSGDTGSAAIDACRDREHIDIFILHPEGRTSEVQRRQMTTVPSANVHNIAVDGTFDDCQDLVKALFADEGFRREVQLSAVNSINWARVMAQIVYYVTSARAVNQRLGRPLDAPVNFCVPTGNFGNIFAGFAAMRMGLAIDQLIVASNSNDILTRFFNTGTMDIRGVSPTLSPSMDIQVSSNLERLLFEMSGRDGAGMAELMLRFRSDGSVTVLPDQMAWLSERFSAGRYDDDECLALIGERFRDDGILIDPHSAVGVGVAERLRRGTDVPTICLGTAHPAKFPDAVEQATGQRPPLPDHLADLFERPERFATMADDVETLKAYVRSHLVSHS
ncbi:MAG TPA: threonine synthase [Microthrixaceae bacterium]|nr:threonine synthase [Microthrixaceae bacterium]HQF94049.1 threonine synthase [Microthrixaceae bacterium]